MLFLSMCNHLFVSVASLLTSCDTFCVNFHKRVCSFPFWPVRRMGYASLFWILPGRLVLSGIFLRLCDNTAFIWKFGSVLLPHLLSRKGQNLGWKWSYGACAFIATSSPSLFLLGKTVGDPAVNISIRGLAGMLDWYVAKYGKTNISAKNGRCPHLKTEPLVKALGGFGHFWSEAITGHMVWRGEMLWQPLLSVFKGKLFPSCWFWFASS